MESQRTSSAWITFVKDGQDVEKAERLGKSLRISATSNQLVAIVGKGVSELSLEKLRKYFTSFLHLPSRDWVQGDLNKDAFIYSWSLAQFDSIVFVGCSGIVLKNCDDIFGFDRKEVGVSSFGENFLVARFQPSIKVFLNLVNACNLQQASGNFGKAFNILENLGKMRTVNLLPPGICWDKETGHLFGSPAIIEYEKVKEEDFQNDHLENNNDTVNGFASIPPEIQQLIDPLDHDVPNFNGDDIAIIGMSLRLPKSRNAEEYWSTIVNGIDAVIPVPESRWTSEQSCTLTPEQKKTEAGFLPVPIDHLDAEFFNISPMELAFIDPQQRLLLELAWEAVEDAGLSSEELSKGKTACFTGSWMCDYRDLMMVTGFKKNEIIRSYMGNSMGSTCAKISHFLKLSGPNMATESGCSASMVAFISACNALKNRDCDSALACGVNLILNPYSFDDIRGLLSPQQRCRTFDASANGFVRSEGCVVMVLKRLSSAMRNEDKILGVIKGYAFAQEGNSRSIGTPTYKGETAVMSEALRKAKVDPADIGFIEAHGTGTAIGDTTEIDAIATAYSTQRREKSLLIGSVKATIGHTESASGLASIAKLILMFKNSTIPPNINIRKLNPKLNLHRIPAEIPMSPIPWCFTKGKARIAGIHNFGITGTYSSVIIQEPPVLKAGMISCTVSPPAQVVCLSAKKPNSLSKLQEAYISFLETNIANKEISLNDIAFTANACRHHFRVRKAIVCNSKEDLLQKLKNDNSQGKDVGTGNGRRAICFLFPGIGTHYYGMCKQFYELSTTFANEFIKCENLLKGLVNFRIRDCIWSDKKGGKLDSIVVSQTSIFVVQYCLTKVLESLGIRPSFLIGHSLGEYAAAVTAGLLTLEQGLQLVIARSRCAEKSPHGAMAALRCSESKVSDLIQKYLRGSRNGNEWIDIAAVNSPDQVTISSTKDTLTSFLAFIEKAENVVGIPLNTSHSFHSRSLDTVYQEMLDEAGKHSYHPKPQDGPMFISSSLGRPVTSVSAKYWADQLRFSVHFEKACNYFDSESLPIFLEVGPKAPLIAALREKAGKTPLIPLTPGNPEKEWVLFLDVLSRLYSAGCDLRWRELFTNMEKRKVSLPFYQFDRKSYWFPVQGMEKNDEMVRDPSGPQPLKSHLLSSGLKSPVGLFICESSLNQKDSTLTYISDHKVAGRTVFPGACFLEMVLSSVEESKFFQRGSFSVRNFNISSSVDWDAFSSHKFQTVFDKNDLVVKLFYFNGTLEEWVLKAEAQIEENGREGKSEAGPSFSLETVRDKLVDVEDLGFYEKLAESGYNFGPNFKSVQSSFRTDDYIIAEIKFPQSEGQESSLHPLLADGLLQAPFLLSLTEGEKVPLLLPAKIGKVILTNKIKGNSFYAYCETKKKENVFLFNEQGDLLVKFLGTDFVKTTAEKYLLSLNQVTKDSVPILEEVFEKGEKFYSNSPVQETCFSAVNSKATANELSSLIENQDLLNKTIALQLYNGFLSMGISKLKSSQTLREVIDGLNISKTYIRTLTRLLEILEEDGFLSTKDSEAGAKLYTFKSKDLTPQNIGDKVEKAFASGVKSVLCHEWKISFLCLQKVVDILQGRVKPLSLLFPESVEAYSAEEFYHNANMFLEGQNLLSNVIKETLSTVFKSGMGDAPLSILEVGAGTGSTTAVVLPLLRESGVPFTYTFTDISAAFFPKAKEMFGSDDMKYSVFDLETDAFQQGYSPRKYDIIIGANVLHATKNLGETCSNLSKILKPGGIIIALEILEKLRVCDVTFGFLDGFWRFTDFETRPSHCLSNGETWKSVLQKSGFEDALSIPDSLGKLGVIVAKSKFNLRNEEKALTEGGKEWIVVGGYEKLHQSLLKQLRCLGIRGIDLERKEALSVSKDSSLSSPLIDGVVFLYEQANLSECDPLEISSQLLQWVQNLINPLKEKGVKVLLVSRGRSAISPDAHTKPSGAVLLGIAKTLKAECPQLHVKVIDLDEGETSVSWDTVALVREMWKGEDDSLLVSYRNRIRFTPKLLEFSEENERTLVKGSSLSLKRFFLQMPPSKLISDVEVVPLPASSEALSPTDVEIEVKAYGMNFREIFSIMKPTKEFEEINVVGVDIAGIVSKVGENVTKFRVGDRVFGAVGHGLPLGSHPLIPESDILQIPRGMSFDLAATFPAGWLTAYHCIVEVAKVQAGETLLIHTASGGVGIFCIQICKKLKANVIATAGSETKRRFLRKYGVPVVSNSRTLEFKDVISKATEGRGVDVVINTITGPGFKEASLDSCKKGARFLEISKLNIWQPKEVFERRPDIDYQIIDLGHPNSFYLRSRAMQALQKYLSEGSVKPLPLVRFDLSGVKDALHYLERAKHVGKVVCVCGDDDNDVFTARKLFNSESTYLITGGTQGVGLATAGWMFDQGARNLLLCARSSPTSDSEREIGFLREKGMTIFVKQADVSVPEDCENILNFLTKEKSLPPLRGIFHAAGCLSDKPIMEQDRDSLLKVFKPKIYGAYNLHKAALKFNIDLDYFVVFSSIMGFLGYPGQCNHVIANNYMDSLIHYRNSMGLPGTSVQWGHWNESGIVAGKVVYGMKPMTNAEAFQAFETVLRSNKVKSAIVRLDEKVLVSLIPWLPQVLPRKREGLNSNEGGKRGKEAVASKDYKDELKKAKNNEEIREIIHTIVKEKFFLLLQLPLETQLDNHSELSDYGLDSLMAIELRNRVQQEVGDRVQILTSFFTDNHSISGATSKIVEAYYAQA